MPTGGGTGANPVGADACGWRLCHARATSARPRGGFHPARFVRTDAYTYTYTYTNIDAYTFAAITTAAAATRCHT